MPHPRLLTISALTSLSTILSFAAAQGATFRNTIPSTVYVGQTIDIEWTAGNGEAVYGTLGNSSFNFPIFIGQPATPGAYDWTVTLPDDVVPGQYQVGIKQSDEPAVYSPPFTIEDTADASTTPTTNPSLISTPSVSLAPQATTNATMNDPSVVTVWDEDCGCTMTKTSTPSPVVPAATTTAPSLSAANAIAPAGTGTGIPVTTYTWYDDECGCTKSAMAPTMTGNATQPMMTTSLSAGSPMTPSVAPAVASYAGSMANGGGREVVHGFGVAIVALLAGVVLV